MPRTPLRTMAQMLMLCCGSVAIAFQTMIMVFIGERPSFQCVEQTVGCRRAITSHSQISANASSWHTECLSSDTSCGSDGRHYEYAVADHRTLASEFDMMCDEHSIWMLGHASSLYMLGASLCCV